MNADGSMDTAAEHSLQLRLYLVEGQIRSVA
jgi:hypothetical protein